MICRETNARNSTGMSTTSLLSGMAIALGLLLTGCTPPESLSSNVDLDASNASTSASVADHQAADHTESEVPIEPDVSEEGPPLPGLGLTSSSVESSADDSEKPEPATSSTTPTLAVPTLATTSTDTSEQAKGTEDKQSTSDGDAVEPRDPSGQVLVNTPNELELAERARKGPADVALPGSEAKGNLATRAELNQEIAKDWPQPQAVLFVSGQQHGYIEPCGCTGLDRQKGGLIRRDTVLTQLRERGWNVLPVDVGNQVRRIGQQPVIKFATTVDAFKEMGYEAATLGIDDLKLSSVELIQHAASDGLSPSAFISANVVIYDESFFPSYRIVEAGGRKIGITGVLGKEHQQEHAYLFRGEENQSADIEFFDPVERLTPVVAELKEKGCDFIVLLAHASLEESASIGKEVDGIDLVVTGGGFGEPTLHPEKIDGSDAIMVQVGVKGMYGGIVGLFDDEKNPIRYQKIAISAQFKDSERMLAKFSDYQNRLKEMGLDGLGATEIPHPTSRKYIGSEACGDCHTTAFEVWEGSPHVHATESIVAANNDRGGIPRHFDPECISCHATGWNAQEYYPYESGFKGLELTEHLLGSGCENCHGPGKSHADAENGEIDVDNETLLKLREQMVITLKEAKDSKCIECHDLDNSPDFHPVAENFERYWAKVKHVGKD